MSIEDQNRAKEERAVYSKHIQANLSEIIETYCRLLQANLVKDTQKLKASFEKKEREVTLEVYISKKIDKYMERDHTAKMENGAPMNPLRYIAEDIITSFNEKNSAHKFLSDKLVYLKVTVLSGETRYQRSNKN